MKLKIPTTPLPDVFFDELMPRLDDSSFRLLLLVARKTLGWADPKTDSFKHRDWLSHSQLKQSLRRSSASVSKAIAELVRMNLLIVEDQLGKELPTPAIRRRHRGRLYFRLSDSLLSGKFQFPLSEVQELKTTINIQDNKNIVVSTKQKTKHSLESEKLANWQRVGELLHQRRYDELPKGRDD